MTCIAIVGTEATTRLLAPYADPDWKIWVCGPGNRGNQLPRCDALFEMHDIKQLEGEDSWVSYIGWMMQLPQVYLLKHDERIKGSTEYPKAEMDRLFGQFFWTSTFAYMMALAISMSPPKIGIYGIEMAVGSEYEEQRAGMQHFVQVAWDRGIEVVTAPHSELLRPMPPYGYRELDTQWHVQEKVRLHLQGHRAEVQKQKDDLEERLATIDGGLQVLRRAQLWITR